MPTETRLLGWELEFHDIVNDIVYKSEIVDLAISQDINTSLIKCKIKYMVDSSFSKYFSKPHYGTLFVMNKMVYTDDIEEIYSVDLEAITNTGSIIVREEDVKQSQIIPITINYYCKQSIMLLNKRVGGTYHKKKIQDIIKDLYNQTDSDLPLKIENFDNKTIYNNIFIQEGSFISAIRYLNQQYGLYDSNLMMYGNTFTDGETNWIITNIDKIQKEDEIINLFFTPYEQRGRKVKSISEREYHIYTPINIKNTISQISKKIPKQLKVIAQDVDKFIKRKDISVPKVLKELEFIKSNKQFDKLLQIDKQMMFANRFDIKDYSVKNAIQQLGIYAYTMPIQIPNPFLIEHFKIGTIINFTSQIEDTMNSTDIKLMIFGWLLRIKQGSGSNGGASYNASLIIRTGATSFLDQENEE